MGRARRAINIADYTLRDPLNPNISAGDDDIYMVEVRVFQSHVLPHQIIYPINRHTHHLLQASALQAQPAFQLQHTKQPSQSL